MRIDLQATVEQDRLIRAAAQAQGKSVNDFILDSACAVAEGVLEERRHIVLGDKEWEAFLQALDRPVQDKPRLQRLFAEPSLCDKP